MRERHLALIEVPLVLLAVSGCRNGSADGSAPEAAPPPVLDAGTNPQTGEPRGTLTTDLDVSTGGAPKHLVLRGLQVARIDPKDMWQKFTLSQTNDDPPDATTRVTFSLQCHSPVKVGARVPADGHLLYEGLIFASDKPCVVVLSSMGPPEGSDHLHSVEGTFSCETMRAPGGGVASVSNGHFGGRFVDTGDP